MRTDEKECHRCHQTKPINRFYKSSSTKSGYRGSCKACTDNPDNKRRYRKVSEVLEDYKFLREHGEDHYACAERIGVTPNHLVDAVAQADCRIMESGEQACYDRILLCIERGKVFSFHDMPVWVDVNGSDFNVAVNVAVARGLCVPVGKRVHVLSNRGNAVLHYRGVACES